VDPWTGTAAVIDPYRAIGPYLEAAQWLSANIRHIFVTEQHDDFPGGHRELQLKTGATLYAGAWTRPPFDFLPVKNGDIFEFGQVRLQVLETPGHRLEAITVLAYDLLASATDPVAAFTGDTLFLGGSGLPEPRTEDGHSPSELSSLLADSIQRKILPLPDSMRLYPAHAGLAPSGLEARSGTANFMKSQRLHNPALGSMTPQDFSHRVLAGMARTTSSSDKADKPRLRAVSPSELLRAARAGAQVVDVRSPADFAASHLERSLNVPIDSAFESWVDAILERGEPSILVAPPGLEAEAATRLESAGFTNVAGYLKEGMQALEDRPQILRGERPYSLPCLEEALQSSEPPLLLEISRGPTSDLGVTIPLEDLGNELGQLPREREIAVCAETPFRTAAAASFLRNRGFPRVRTLAGGLALWGRRPLERPTSVKKA
jgi:rhodanese-related sulfurtransferase/glyoxylase-like metal-dependent hydrolase (beta-lactamase superfamily II)